ncbi:MAG: tRNA (5-methylaminomethyl-2-thiouridine)(34)-methyltransferase MnmD [Bacteroidota bacterium]|nr:tRNA (5-methylaminomethyl-2-thiouridine)(34)-methyltransferase MnmD [Bacteroidota bacterium]
MERQLITTADGSHTLFVPGLQDHYHSTYGAVQESRHIYIRNAFRANSAKNTLCQVLEIGFGTGLNALLTWQESILEDIPVQYTALEPFPLETALAMQLNYPGLMEIPGANSIFQEMHSSPWDQAITLNRLMKLLKVKVKIQDSILAENQYDVVYFDAFGPDVQAEMWTVDIFNKIYVGMKRGGVLTTFSAKGIVRRAMTAAGFEVEKLPGPPGKRTITRAWKR